MRRECPDGIVIRDLRPDDMEAFHGPERPSSPSMRAWVAEKDGEVRVIGGIARALDSRWYAFLDVRQDDEFARSHQILIGRFARMFIDQLDSLGVKYVYALVDQREKNAFNWMERLGFHVDPRSGSLMRWKKES